MNESTQDESKIVRAQVVDIMAPEDEDSSFAQIYQPPERRVFLPFLLFLATCLSTFVAQFINVWDPDLSFQYEFMHAVGQGLKYAIPLMIILVCHEMGHFIQSRRYGVFASWPYFIPFLPPIGTMGAVIFMEPRMGHRKALFDIGITGPLAGLVPTIICCIIGIKLSHDIQPNYDSFRFGEPLLFSCLTHWLGVQVPAGYHLIFHPIAFAGWVGLLITSLNLVPIGQLDGGHILYALLKKNSHYVATFLLLAALVCVARNRGLWSWSLMLILLILIGPQHPPTANDNEPLGLFRCILGWCTLAFVLIGFTPQPFIFPS